MAGRPNDANAITGHVRGLKEAKLAFQSLEQVAREALLEATETTVSEIARGAQARIAASPSIQTRSLYNHIAWRVTKSSGRGRVGVSSGETRMVVAGRKVKVKGIVVAGKGGSASHSAGAKLIRPSRYAHMVEFGTVHMSAEPFMIPSAEAQRDPYLQRAIRAGKAIEQNLAAIGMRNA